MQSFDHNAGNSDPKIGTTMVPATSADPYGVYAQAEGGGSFFDGDYLRLDQTAGWVRGQDKTKIDTTDAWVANMAEAHHGWVRFGGEGGPERDVVRIAEQPLLPVCRACGEDAQYHDDNPRVCAWKPAVYLPLRSVSDPGDVVVFTGTGKGARRAVAQLCGTYSRQGANRQGRDPLIRLEVRKFENSSGGTTIWPVLKWIGLEFFTPGIAAPEVQPIAAPKALPPTNSSKRGDMDDEIPF